jgi:hypothetical protein
MNERLTITGDGKEFFGTLGVPSHYQDDDGLPLFVGDIVELWYRDLPSKEPTMIVQYNGKVFVMGIEGSCNPITGSMSGWHVKKLQSFINLYPGCGVRGLTITRG